MIRQAGRILNEWMCEQLSRLSSLPRERVESLLDLLSRTTPPLLALAWLILDLLSRVKPLLGTIAWLLWSRHFGWQ